MTVCGTARRAIMPKYTSKSAAALADAARRKVGHCRAFYFLKSRKMQFFKDFRGFFLPLFVKH
jgi:hypothetical protein